MDRWYVVHDLRPLGWRVVYASRDRSNAEHYLESNGLNSRYQVVDSDTWAHSMLLLMLSDEPWQKLGELAAESTRWREHEHQQEWDMLVYATRRDPVWTSPIHIGQSDSFTLDRQPSLIDRALRRADHLMPPNVGGDEDNKSHDSD